MLQSVPQYLLIFLALLCLWQLVRLSYAVIVPIGPLGDWKPQSAQIMAADQRKSLFSSFDPFFRTASQGAEMATVTSLGLTLFGINLNEATGGGSAIIAGEDGVQTSFAVGDEIMAGVTLAALAFDHVILERGSARETLFIDQSDDAGGEAVPDAAEPQGDAAPRQAADAAAPELTADAMKQGVRFAPRLENGKVTGLTVQPQGDGAIFRAAGLRSGDVVRSINGRAITSASDVAGAASAFQSGARISLEVERGASSVPIALFLAKS